MTKKPYSKPGFLVFDNKTVSESEVAEIVSGIAFLFWARKILSSWTIVS